MKRFIILFVAVFPLIFFIRGFSQNNSLEYRISFNNSLKTSSSEFFFQPPEEYDFIGVSAYCMDKSQAVTLYYRLKRLAGWTVWTAFRVFTDGDTPDRVSFEAPPIYGDFSAIQFKTDQTVSEEMVFRLFIPDPQLKIRTESLEIISDSTEGCSSLMPEVCRRDCWCPSGACSKEYTPTLTQSTHIIIHHSAGHNSSDNFAAVVAYYWDFHVNTNGWSDIGYNWLIDPNGIIYEGRGDGVQGAHFSCMNGKTTGICIIGNYVNTNPTEASMQSLKSFLAWEVCSKELDPVGLGYHSSSRLRLYTISGHRDGNRSTSSHSCASGTVCPGDSLYELLPQIRTDVAILAGIISDELGQQTDYLSLNRFQVFPNPSQGEFSISLGFKDNARNYRIEILDVTGRVLSQKSGVPVNGDMIFQFTNELPSGQYLVKVSTDQEIVAKAIIMHR
ncbi:MAG: N-acetylmuramoyl-L-alanine amidase [Bacteroidota bacterium]|nr:N-acetylmuramoyl-L-alanine amidase [Bacteroidota bacterium]